MGGARRANGPIPRWLRFVLISDRAGSAAYIGAGFFFSPVLAVLSPWPTLTAVCWVIIGLAGLWLGLRGIARPVAIAMVLRAGAEIPEDYWRSIPSAPDTTVSTVVSLSILTYAPFPLPL